MKFAGEACELLGEELQTTSTTTVDKPHGSAGCIQIDSELRLERVYQSTKSAFFDSVCSGKFRSRLLNCYLNLDKQAVHILE